MDFLFSAMLSSYTDAIPQDTVLQPATPWFEDFFLTQFTVLKVGYGITLYKKKRCIFTLCCYQSFTVSK